MALMERDLTPVCDDCFGFNSLFEEMDREFDDMHRCLVHDMRHMRHAMTRLQPHHEEDSLRTGFATQLQQIRNPIVTNKDGSRKLQLQLDVSSFKPEEVKIKTEGRQLKIHAKHEDKTESGDSMVYHEFSRQFTLPEEVDPEAVTAKLSSDGVLTIQSPSLPAIEDGSGEPQAKIAKTDEA